MRRAALMGGLMALAACGPATGQEQAAAAPEKHGADQALVAPPPATPEVKPPKKENELAAAAGAYRWNSSFLQGTSEALVRNNRAEELNVSVRADSELSDDAEADGSVFLTLQPPLKPDETFYIEVDGERFTFAEGADYEATSDHRRQMRGLINALQRSTSPFVTVEVPGRSYKTAFSTKGMRDAFTN